MATNDATSEFHPLLLELYEATESQGLKDMIRAYQGAVDASGTASEHIRALFDARMTETTDETPTD